MRALFAGALSTRAALLIGLFEVCWPYVQMQAVFAEWEAQMISE